MKKFIYAAALFGALAFNGAANADQVINDNLIVHGQIVSDRPGDGTLLPSAKLVHTGGVPAQVSTAGTDATPVITEVYIAEVYIPAPMFVTGVAIMNGTVASDDMKVGLADSSGAVVAENTAGVTASGADAYQRVAFSGVYLAKAGTYFVLLKLDGTTSRFNTHTFGNFGASKQTGQTYAAAFAAITPPTTFTTAVGPIASLY